jgi:hypothetical protein
LPSDEEEEEEEEALLAGLLPTLPSTAAAYLASRPAS